MIVGSSVAGVSTARHLRAAGFDEPITMIGEERHKPYDKPPLTKAMLAADGDGSPTSLVSDEDLARFSIDLRLGTRATALDPVRRLVTLDAGPEIGYEHLVIATGVTPRRLPGMDGLAGVHTIRTADDAFDLRSELVRAPSVVVIGAGFIGAEFAAAAHLHGCQVSVVEAQNTPMANIVGDEVGSLLSNLHAAHGVHLITGAAVSRFEGQDRVTAVVLEDGRTIPADLVVVGIGATPATDWLATSGLPIANGVECDDQLRVIGFPGIYAAGDVACRPHPHYDGSVRIEHWTSATEHGEVVAASVMQQPIRPPAIPYVWSDQYGHRIQIIGRPSAGTLATLSGDACNRLAAFYGDASGVLVGAVVVDDPRLMLRSRKAIASRAPVNDLTP